VWDKWYEPSGAVRIGAPLPVPVSTNKMRGPLSKQPKKVGLHAPFLIDHVYFGSSQLKLVTHVGSLLAHDSARLALQSLLPTLANPSDHVPVIVDFDILQDGDCRGNGESPAKRAKVSG